MEGLYHSKITCNTTEGALTGMAGNGVLIMDSCPVTALGIKQILTEKCGIFESFSYAQNLADIPSLIASTLPSLLIMDICGEKEHVLEGLRLLKYMRKAYPMTKIIICTDFNDKRVLELIVASHASGILLKQEPILAFAQCIDNVRDGNRKWLTPKVKIMISSPELKNARLTSKELDVLAHLLSGMNVSQVAQNMLLNIRTVSTHKRRAMLKLGLINDSELFCLGAKMVKTGLLEKTEPLTKVA